MPSIVADRSEFSLRVTAADIIFCSAVNHPPAELIGALLARRPTLTVVVGIAHMGELRQVGRIGVKALVYFEVMTTLALVIGLVSGAYFGRKCRTIRPPWRLRHSRTARQSWKRALSQTTWMTR